MTTRNAGPLALLLAAFGACSDPASDPAPAPDGGGAAADAGPADSPDAGPPDTTDAGAADGGVETLPARLARRLAERYGATPPAPHPADDAAAAPLLRVENGRIGFPYRGPGDYNFDGKVDAADAQALAQYEGMTAADAAARGLLPAHFAALDGDGDGVVGAGDLEPTVRRWGAQVDGYRLLRLADPPVEVARKTLAQAGYSAEGLYFLFDPPFGTGDEPLVAEVFALDAAGVRSAEVRADSAGAAVAPRSVAGTLHAAPRRTRSTPPGWDVLATFDDRAVPVPADGRFEIPVGDQPGLLLALPQREEEKGFYAAPLLADGRRVVQAGSVLSLAAAGDGHVDATTTVLSLVLMHPMFEHPAAAVQGAQIQWLLARSGDYLAQAATAWDAAIGAGTDPAEDAAVAAALRTAVERLGDDLPEFAPASQPQVFAPPRSRVLGLPSADAPEVVSYLDVDESESEVKMEPATRVGTSLDYLAVVERLDPLQSFPLLNASREFGAPSFRDELGTPQPVFEGYVQSRSYFGYVDIVGKTIGAVTELLGTPLAPEEGVRLAPGIYRVLFFSGGLGVGAGASEAQYRDVDRIYKMQAGKAFRRNVVTAFIEGVSLLPGAEMLLGDKDTGPLLLAAGTEAVRQIEAVVLNRYPDIAADDIYEILFNTGKSVLDAYIEKATEKSQKRGWIKLLRWAKAGGKKALQLVMSVPGKVAKGGSLAHRALRLAAPESVVESQLLLVDAPLTYDALADGELLADGEHCTRGPDAIECPLPGATLQRRWDGAELVSETVAYNHLAFAETDRAAVEAYLANPRPIDLMVGAPVPGTPQSAAARGRLRLPLTAVGIEFTGWGLLGGVFAHDAQFSGLPWVSNRVNRPAPDASGFDSFPVGDLSMALYRLQVRLPDRIAGDHATTWGEFQYHGGETGRPSGTVRVRPLAPHPKLGFPLAYEFDVDAQLVLETATYRKDATVRGTFVMTTEGFSSGDFAVALDQWGVRTLAAVELPQVPEPSGALDVTVNFTSEDQGNTTCTRRLDMGNPPRAGLSWIDPGYPARMSFTLNFRDQTCPNGFVRMTWQ